jgi:FkbM family methyltransferase
MPQVPSLLKTLIPRYIIDCAKKFLEPRSLWLSQAGQDFWVVGECFNGMRDGFFLDIGAHDGVYLSNTFLLESQFAWKGICIEANPETFIRLTKQRRALCVNLAVDSKKGHIMFNPAGVMGGIVAEGFDNEGANEGSLISVETDTLESILNQHNSPRIIDYLSIDIEGAEERALMDFNFTKYIFRAITIERPTANLRQLISKNHYILIRDIPGLDCFYIHESFSDRYTENMYRFWDRKLLAWQWGGSRRSKPAIASH